MHFYQEKKCGNSWQRSQCSGNSETLAGSHHLGNSSLLHSLKSSVCAKASSFGFQSVASFQERSQQHPCRRVNRDGKIARKQRGDSPILVSLCQRKSVIREENMGFLNSGKRQGHAFNLRKVHRPLLKQEGFVEEENWKRAQEFPPIQIFLHIVSM